MGINDGRVVIVTGSGRGIGREHALAYAATGAKVVVNDLGGDTRGEGGDLSPAMETVEDIKKMGGEAIAQRRERRRLRRRRPARAIGDRRVRPARRARQQRRHPARPHARQHGRVGVGRGDRRPPQGHVRPDPARRRVLAQRVEGRPARSTRGSSTPARRRESSATRARPTTAPRRPASRRSRSSARSSSDATE